MKDGLLPGEMMPGVRSEKGRLVLRPDTPTERDARLDMWTVKELTDQITELQVLLPGISSAPTRAVVISSIALMEAALARKES